ncbi:restriction endonuclease subunit S [Deinococcus sp. 23YEL01]|uniref:restriction endonuclease subunit S n=1 Tax=Deinococcus sp. 23YEL01 TaxID=2745871 RepID=UPI001E4257CA|nr:restriction endonuclease subunit S [Deinococcus sp. 23YEL01]MCD0168246.1 restriction endonuclease subunit S [Deinococcus sp. 23YEL01]
MNSKWFKTIISDQAPLQRGFDITQKTANPGDVPVISSGGISYYTDNPILSGPGVVIGRKGTLGTVFYVASNYWPSDTTLWITDFKGNNPKFVYYFYKTLSVMMLNLDVGSANPTLNRNHLHSREILWTDRQSQDRIAEILSSFDDKIELNRQMNRTLEQIARALFKSWFIDFDPVHAKQRGEQPAGMDAETAALFPDRFVEIDGKEVPEGWKVKALDSVADFLNGLALQKYPPTGEDDLPIIKIAQLRKGNTEGSGLAGRNVGSKYTVQDGDVLFSWSGSLEVVRWSGGEGALNQHLFKVTSSTQPAWFVYYWLLEHLPHFREIAANKATTMGHIQRGHLTDAKVYVPEKNLLDALGRQMQPVFEQIFQNDLEARRLAELRDSLLPRLLSGELDVSDWENAVEDPEGAPA